MEVEIQTPVCASKFLFYAIEENGRDVIELHQSGIATTSHPFAESQEESPIPRLTRLPGGRLKQSLLLCRLLTVQNCSHCLKKIDLRVVKMRVTARTDGV